MANNTITSPRGFLAAGLGCGIKKSGRYDLGLLICPSGANAAAVFTTNKLYAAPVAVSKKHIASKPIFGVVVNSGNANACTGKKGFQDAITMCGQTAGWIKADPNEILVASTGIIGKPLPIDKIKAGIKRAAGKLSSSGPAGLDFANAIMTTDTKVKQAVRRIKISGKDITIAATAKGAGMIAPKMATTLCFITTDAAIGKKLLKKGLVTSIDNSLNKLTVDGHQSTNDSAIILASGLADNRPYISSLGPDYKKFVAALSDLCEDLMRQMALDAEGATRMFKVVVRGAARKRDAAKAARAVADYDLVKCAVHGADPNWGRILCAIGSCSTVTVNREKLRCKIGNITVFENGQPKKFDARSASKIISAKEHTITIELGMGKATDFCYGCDLSREYVKINADYHT